MAHLEVDVTAELRVASKVATTVALMAEMLVIALAALMVGTSVI